MNIFEQAMINKFRFDTDRGSITTEQLWDVPLTSKAGFNSKVGFDLNIIARDISRSIKLITESDFVSKPDTAKLDELEAKLEIVKYIIEYKKTANEEFKQRAMKRAEREKLIDILATKQDEALKTLTVEELAARIAALGSV